MIHTTDTIHQLTVPTPFGVGDVHMYVLKGETLTLVDAGIKTEEAWKVFVHGLQELGYTPEDVEQVMLTHHHPDHIGLLDRFSNLKGIYGHEDNRRWLERDEAFLNRYHSFFYDLYSKFGVSEEYKSFFKHLRDPLKYVPFGTLTGSLVEGDGLPGHEDWEVLETPGHAESHLSFYRKQDGKMISGDHLLYHISSNPLLEPPRKPGGERPKPLLSYRQTMEKCLHYPISEVLPGHGPIFTGVHDIIHTRFEKQEQRAEKVYDMLVDKPLSPFEVCQKLFPKHIKKEFGLTMSETVGQLDYLEATHRVHVELQNGVVYYQAI
ncbi:MBL fold metallo-hydrolase [Pontibacillus yanchengensis]|uniref:Beta-lactamase n=1 Tax=Pontibacillus yanchengensis Y32 TaxID=1385514 RepID=A0A0A2T9B7_9BACI|nr:MBL fold metallo-hydrolase [Pontibacillus yanchengensis]KGP72154.1 beta-lactamase [Pontibacillus yanchengensis Y32]